MNAAHLTVFDRLALAGVTQRRLAYGPHDEHDRVLRVVVFFERAEGKTWHRDTNRSLS